MSNQTNEININKAVSLYNQLKDELKIIDGNDDNDSFIINLIKQISLSNIQDAEKTNLNDFVFHLLFPNTELAKDWIKDFEKEHISSVNKS